MQVLPIWALAIPLPAVLMITVSLYMMLLAVVLWIRCYMEDTCSDCWDRCCPRFSLWQLCFQLGEKCDCRLPNIREYLPKSCPRPTLCKDMDCACTCQLPECDTCNCLCFEVRIK